MTQNKEEGKTDTEEKRRLEEIDRIAAEDADIMFRRHPESRAFNVAMLSQEALEKAMERYRRPNHGS